jgi:hypothetical protein
MCQPTLFNLRDRFGRPKIPEEWWKCRHISLAHPELIHPKIAKGQLI